MNDEKRPSFGASRFVATRAGLATNPVGAVFSEILIGEPWMADGICGSTDPDAFFVEKGGSTKPAKLICNGGPRSAPCPVREQCLRYALDRDERFGVWGGLSERERSRLKRGLPPLRQRRLVGHYARCDCDGCTQLRGAA